ncbi:acetyltransferase YpeA [Peptococcaceae bacterium CEB3]|nr:acetyltransferase YpeA [Peptococcaceae bacterium CEB3]
MYKIRSYSYKDEKEVLKLWNICLTRDPINRDVFHKKVLLDPNFEEKLCLVAEADRQIVGFILGMVRKYPYEERGLEPERGWISVVFVHPALRREGIARALVEKVEDELRRLGRKNVTLASYSPNYFFPGPDKDVYGDSIEFFQKMGYEVLGEAVGMDAVLYDFSIPQRVAEMERALEAAGYRFEIFDGTYTLPLLRFLHEHFPGGWVRNVRDTLLKGRGEERLMLAFDKEGKIVGYCQRAMDDLAGHFGPFGVDERLRGQKIGTVLFYKMLFDMYSRGIYHVWLAWTDGEAQKFYERAGMKVNKRHAVMKKSLK